MTAGTKATLGPFRFFLVEVLKRTLFDSYCVIK